MSNENEEPKIIVDDDWKTQVEQEKEAIQKQMETNPQGGDEQPAQEVPPASFSILVSTLATQAMAALGILPDPSTGEPNPNPAIAKHFIDTLGVLQEKTKGNLDEAEAGMLKDALHQLRMIFVTVDTEAKKEAGSSSDDVDSKKPTIELP